MAWFALFAVAILSWLAADFAAVEAFAVGNSAFFGTRGGSFCRAPLTLSAGDSDSVTVSVDSASQPTSTAQKGDVVTVHWTLTPEGEFVPETLFDSNEEVTFILGQGNFLPGLHQVVETLSVGETKTQVQLDAGWGDRRDDLIAKLPKDNLGLDYDKVNVGTELFLANGLKCVVTEVTETDFTIDANPPLAGASYLADVTLNKVEKAPSFFEYASSKPESEASRYEVATFALGCFWGAELAFMREPGVVGTKVGYTQGAVVEPSYEQVCSGTTGHTEAVQVVYDPTIVSFQRLVRLTMDRLGDNAYLLNQVGNDRGTQYRHGVYYHNDGQKQVAEEILESFGPKCQTECKPALTFYDAEDYHQQYLLKGGQSARKGDATTIRCYG